MKFAQCSLIFLALAASCNAFQAQSLSPYRSSFTSGFQVVSQPARRDGTQLNMMFDQLAKALTDVAQNFGQRKKITEESIKPALRQVRRALLDADVNLDVADALIDGVKKRSLGDEVIKGVTAEQQFIKSMYDELLDMMGGDSKAAGTMGGSEKSIPVATLALGKPGNPAVVLLAGLQGAGKTTAAGKLALYLKEREVDYSGAEDSDEPIIATDLPKRNRKVLLVAADVYRPAAIKQLEILAESIGVEVFSLGTDADPVDIAKQAVQKAKNEGFDTVVVDTAGRQVIDTDLMNELKQIQKAVKPSETLLVVDAMTGQEAASLTAAFDSAVGLTGAILTKLDGDSRGGAAVSVRGVSGKPIKFVGVGERVADLEPFFPDRMASRILGMGDVVSLVEKASAQVSKEEAQRMQEKMMAAEFDFNDFLQQAKLVSTMGSLGGVAKMMPGMQGIGAEQMRAAERRLKKNEAMINSMTKKERSNPALLITDQSARSRLRRIAKGSGNKFEDAAAFLSEFQKMRTLMSRMSKNMAGAGGQDGSMAGVEDVEAMLPGNRSARRAQKKKKKGAKGFAGGFG